MVGSKLQSSVKSRLFFRSMGLVIATIILEVDNSFGLFHHESGVAATGGILPLLP